MRERSVPTHGGGLPAYGPSRLPWVERRWQAARHCLILATLAVSAGSIGLMVADWPAVGSLVLAVPVAVWALVALALLSRPQARINRYADLQLWRSVEKTTSAVLRALPALKGLVDVKEADALIRQAHWDIACLIDDRSNLVRAQREATWSAYGLAPDDPLRGELALRREWLDEQLTVLDNEARRRVDRLTTMAQEAAAFARQQAALRRAPAMTRRARRAVQDADDTVAETLARWQATTDPAAELVERTTAVLSAYRELSAPVTDPR